MGTPGQLRPPGRVKAIVLFAEQFSPFVAITLYFGWTGDMNTSAQPGSNLPAVVPVPRPGAPDLSLATPFEQAGPSSATIDFRLIGRGLTRHWWRILALSLAIGAPIEFLVYHFVQPQFEASSMLRIENTQAEIFGELPGRKRDEFVSSTFLQTQTRLMTSDKVLNPAIADVLVNDLPAVKKSRDFKTELRKSLQVMTLNGANLIRITLEMPNPEEAVTVVKAVVQSYLTQDSEYNRSANRGLTESLTQQLVKIGTEIDARKLILKSLVRQGELAAQKQPQRMLNNMTGADSTQPTFKTLPDSEIQHLISRMIQTDLELIDAQSTLEIKLAAETAYEKPADSSTELNARVMEEFRNDPAVRALVTKIDEKFERLDHTKEIARQRHDPARVAAQKEVDKLRRHYDQLWTRKRGEILQRLTTSREGRNERSPESIPSLRLRVAALARLKEKQSTFFSEMNVDQAVINDETFGAAYLDRQISNLMNWERLVTRNLEQLRFEANHARFRVVVVDPASAPRAPSSDRRPSYLAAAPVGVIFLVLGLFLVLEIKAEHVADPDALWHRMHTEVYTLPPLPAGRDIRALDGANANDQSDHFIQQLDHLRFAMCGDPAARAKVKCVVITSAVSGEGKTTLAGQLAIRCGTTGISTLLIDADLHRAGLSRLFDVPAGPGLSDVLQNAASIDAVTIPIQGGAFTLLTAGSPVQDTGRLFQSPSFGHLMSELRQRYDLIIIDSPPILPVPDALMLGRWVDGAVITARYSFSRFSQVERAQRQLACAGIAVLGTVINGARYPESCRGYRH